MRIGKHQQEREVFEGLAPLLGWQVVANSIEQPDPPDIVCEIVDLGRLAVELVAIDASETRTRLDNMATVDDAWARALQTWREEDQESLRTETRDVFFSIGFSNDAGMRDRTNVLKNLQKFMLQHRGFTGALAPSTIGHPRGLSFVKVHRVHVTFGPKFSHFSAGQWLPMQVAKVEEKLRPGRYAFHLPMELFVYAVHDEPDLAIGSLEEIEKVIAEGLSGSAFRRVHVFDFGLRRHLLSYPN